eukprot:CAMPEP_0195525828 /NCGR_PEP_ID=MMETSP0794_2-20130614/26482_1 /TAXON_ID=515487 /ORGANISM="Stephanopyxis turris, Strain CCMP 815" /LENGTH=49 /DNA_ID=CAMNT_0040656369 /DNA_START=60 /DNA_END=209 /DNA_ORIENTATION=+
MGCGGSKPKKAEPVDGEADESSCYDPPSEDEKTKIPPKCNENPIPTTIK